MSELGFQNLPFCLHVKTKVHRDLQKKNGSAHLEGGEVSEHSRCRNCLGITLLESVNALWNFIFCKICTRVCYCFMRFFVHHTVNLSYILIWTIPLIYKNSNVRSVQFLSISCDLVRPSWGIFRRSRGFLVRRYELLTRAARISRAIHVGIFIRTERREIQKTGGEREIIEDTGPQGFSQFDSLPLANPNSQRIVRL